MPAEGFVMPAKGFVMPAKGMTKCPPRALPNARQGHDKMPAKSITKSPYNMGPFRMICNALYFMFE
jgi:hypothetical protein